jgi:hypothetical protein
LLKIYRFIARPPSIPSLMFSFPKWKSWRFMLKVSYLSLTSIYIGKGNERHFPIAIGHWYCFNSGACMFMYTLSIPFRLPGSNQEKKGTLLGGFPYMSRSFPFLGDQVGEVSLTFLPVCRSFYIAWIVWKRVFSLQLSLWKQRS